MKRLLASVLSLALGLGLVACGGDGPSPGADVAEVGVDAVADAADTSSPEDTGADDAADTGGTGDTADDDALEPADTSGPDDTVPFDTSPGDTSPGDVTEPVVPLAGFGGISGDCGVIDTELYDPEPSLFVNAIDFYDDPYDAGDFDLLTAWGQEVITDGNAGGSSILSEVFAMEVLARCELATLVATETEIVYDVQGKITDLLVTIDGELVGVSVTRAVGFPFDAPYTVAQAKAILEKKLADILVSSANVSDEHRWVKQILHVLAYAEGHAASIETAWASLDASVRADTIVIVTVTDGADGFMY